MVWLYKPIGTKMLDINPTGQGTLNLHDAFASIQDAIHRLRRNRRLETASLRDAYLAINPRGHTGLHHSYPDLQFLAAAFGLGGPALFRSEHFVITEVTERVWPSIFPLDDAVELRVTQSPESPADALALALGLDAEARKIQEALLGHEAPGMTLAARLLGVTEQQLIAALGGQEELAQEALGILRSGPTQRILHLPGPGSTLPIPVEDVQTQWPSETLMGPLVICSGASERCLDLLSPYVRELHGPLKQLADNQLGAHDADTLYDILPLLFQQDAQCNEERQQVDAQKGIIPVGRSYWIRFASLDVAGTDERVRPSLKRLQDLNLVMVITGRDPADLENALEQVGPHCRHILLVGEGLLPQNESPYFPDIFGAPNGTQFSEISNSMRRVSRDGPQAAKCVQTVSGLGFTPQPAANMPTEKCYNSNCYDSIQAILRAKTRNILAMETRLACGLYSPRNTADASHILIEWLSSIADDFGSS
jgi:hypothetical protein